MNAIENKRLIVHPDVVFREEEDGSFLFHPDTGELKSLNPMGSIVWNLCDGNHSFQMIEEELIKAYPSVPREKIHEDLSIFLNELFEMKYLHYSFDGSSQP